MKSLVYLCRYFRTYAAESKLFVIANLHFALMVFAHRWMDAEIPWIHQYATAGISPD